MVDEKMFKLLLDMLEEAVREDCEQKWISVKDRLPEKGQLVLVFNQEDYLADVYAWFGDCYSVDFFSDIFKDDDDFKVTHWIPLPEPPEVSHE